MNKCPKIIKNFYRVHDGFCLKLNSEEFKYLEVTKCDRKGFKLQPLRTKKDLT